MAGLVFISYSRTDRPYVERLAAHLRTAGFVVWYDYELGTGDRFDHIIQEQIDSCAAFLTVMTPEANASHWVGAELTYALTRKKPVLPLLLRGDPFMALGAIEYENVTSGRMPSDRFMARLRNVAGGPVSPSVRVQPPGYQLSSLARRSTGTFPMDSLDDGEQVTLHLHPHAIVLLVPALWLAASAGMVVAAVLWLSGPLLYLSLACVVAFAAWRWFPRYLVWNSTQYVFTNRQVLLHWGVDRPMELGVPLSKIQEISVVQSLSQQILGSGTLRIESAGGYGRLDLLGVPSVIRVRNALRDLVEHDAGR